MSTIGVRELARNASAIINQLDKTKEPAPIPSSSRTSCSPMCRSS
jgi:hypothetical protein